MRLYNVLNNNWGLVDGDKKESGVGLKSSSCCIMKWVVVAHNSFVYLVNSTAKQKTLQRI